MADAAKMKKPLEAVKKAAESGNYRISPHAEQRMKERGVNLPEIAYILKNGYHEASKDEFNQQWHRWRYAIRGKTIDQRDIRVVVSFDGKMWIVTVIDKDQ